MRRAFLKDASAGTQFLYTALVVVGFWLVFQLLSLFSGLVFFNSSFEGMVESFQDYDDPKTIGLLKYVQALTSFGMFIVAAFAAAWAISERPFRYLRIDSIPNGYILIIVIVLMVFTLPMNNYLTWLNAKLQLPEGLSWLQTYFETKEEQMEGVMIKFLTVEGIGGLLLNLLIIAIIPAIGEELIFRGLVQPILIKGLKNVHYAVILTAFIFGILHFQFLSFLPRFILGIILGYIYVFTRSLWYPIIAHFVNNAVAVVFYFLYYSERAGDGMDQLGKPGHTSILTLLSFIVVCVLLWVLWKEKKEIKA